MNDLPDAELARLMHDGDWLRGFVASLVPPQDVDDVVQSTWLAALQTRGVARSVRHWVAGAATNLARLVHRKRSRGERALREIATRTAAANAHAPAAAELVAAVEVQRLVSAALLDLPEPTRTVLVLRYRHDLSPAAIGARVGLDAAAVRQRLHRGRELVRAQLARRLGDDWRTSSAVIAFVHAPARSVALPAAAAIVLVALGAAAIVAAPWSSTPPPARAEHAATATATDTVRARGEASSSSGPTAAGAHEPALAARLAMQDPRPPVRTAATPFVVVRGRVVATEDGKPLPGVQVTGRVRHRRDATPAPEERTPRSTTTTADGRFEISVSAAAIGLDVGFVAPGRCMRWYGKRSPPENADLGDVAMAAGHLVRGVLVDERGTPLGGVRLELPIPFGVPEQTTLSLPCTTAADGSFAWQELFPAGPREVRSESAGIRLRDAVVDVRANLAPLRLVGERLPSIRGVVFDADGEPCAGVSVAACSAAPALGLPSVLGRCVSAPDGSFEVFRREGDEESALLGTDPFGSHDLDGEPRPTTWNSSGHRLRILRTIGVVLRVCDEAGAPIEHFAAVSQRRRGTQLGSSGTDQPTFHERGEAHFPALALGTRLLVWGAEAEHAYVWRNVDASVRPDEPLVVVLRRSRPTAVHVVDARGRPLATELLLIDRQDATDGEHWSDPRHGRHDTTNDALLLHRASSDAAGAATLLVPPEPRDLVVTVRHAGKLHTLPLPPPAAGQPARLVVPD